MCLELNYPHKVVLNAQSSVSYRIMLVALDLDAFNPQVTTVVALLLVTSWDRIGQSQVSNT